MYMANIDFIDFLFNHTFSLPSIKSGLRWVVNDCVEAVHQVLGLHGVEVHDDGRSFGLHVNHVVGLISKHGDPHHGDTVVDGLVEPIGSTMCDKSSGLGVTF